MIDLQGVTKHYPGFTLGPLDLAIEEGFVTGFVGANGAGKTTTIKLLLRMAHPDSGTIQRPDMADIGVVLDTPSYDGDWRVSRSASAAAVGCNFRAGAVQRAPAACNREAWA